MGPEMYACDMCSKNCWLQHRKKHGDSPLGTTFFKVMFGNKFDLLLHVPPAFSKKLKSQVGEKFSLQDSDRRKWNVLLSNVEGSLAFQKGWHNFVLDHGIELGDMLVFHYFCDLHFLVQIFGRSGCEKVSTRGRPDKSWETETTRTSVPKKRPSDSLYEQSAQRKQVYSRAFAGTSRPMKVNTERDQFNSRAFAGTSRPRNVNTEGEQFNSRTFGGSNINSTLRPRNVNSEREQFKSRAFAGSNIDSAPKPRNVNTQREQFNSCGISGSDIDISPRHRNVNTEREQFNSCAFAGSDIDTSPRPRNVYTEREQFNSRAFAESDIDISPSPKNVYTEGEQFNSCGFSGSDIDITPRPRNVNTEKEHFDSCAFAGSDIDITPRPRNVNTEKEPSAQPRTVPCRENTHERPAVVSAAESLVDPCFMTIRDTNSAVEDDKDRLFDLSTFEMPSNRAAVDREQKRDYLPELPTFETETNGNTWREVSKTLQNAETAIPDRKSVFVREDERDSLQDLFPFDVPDIATEVNGTSKLNLQGYRRSHVSGTFQNAEPHMPDRKAIFDMDEEADYLHNVPIFEMHVNDYANVSGKDHLDGNLCCQASDMFQNAETGAATSDLEKCLIPERNSEVLSGGTTSPVNQKAILLKQEFCANVVADSPPGASIFTCEQTYADLGDKTEPINKEFKQEYCGKVGADSSFSASVPTGEQNSGDLVETSIQYAMNNEGENMRPVKQEAVNICDDVMADSCLGVETSCENSCPLVKDFANVSILAKPEPLDYDVPSGIAIQVRCLPPDSKDFLELPEPLPVKPQGGRRTRTKLRQQLVFLRDQAGRLWPVVYHLKNGFMVLASGWKEVVKANDIQPGDDCLFMLENFEESIFTLEIVHN